MDQLKVAPVGKRFLATFIDFALMMLIMFTLFFFPVRSACEAIFDADSMRDDYNQLLIDYDLVYKDDNGNLLYTDAGMNQESDEYKAFNEDPRIVEIYSQEKMFTFVELTSSLTITLVVYELIIPLCLKGGASIGKKICGLILVDDNFIKIKRGALVLRFLSMLFVEGIISFFTYCIPLILDLILLFATKSHWTIHDFFAQSKVIEKESLHFDNVASRVEFDELHKDELAEKK